MYRFIGIVLVGSLLMAGCSTGDQTADSPLPETSPEITEGAQAPSKSFVATLADVTNGAVVGERVNTKGFGTGTAQAVVDTEYKLEATFGKLPELSDEYFYEGWVVRSTPLSVISTGEAVAGETSGEWVNTYVSETDLSDHERYIVTLEPRDGDPAPADHILEGTFEEN